jgi:hypothetical protein
VSDAFSFPATIKVDRDVVRGLLCCAFEGGSNYWYGDLHIKRIPDPYGRSDVGEGGKLQPEGGYWHWSQLLPTIEGGAVGFTDTTTGEIITLDRMTLDDGLRVMHKVAPKHFADAIGGNDDAMTGDVFLQCCVFGEVRYG